MKDSIIIDMRYADRDIINGAYPVDRHHVLEGTGKRQLSDDDGLWVGLSKSHHIWGERPGPGTRCDAHDCKIFGSLLHMIGQLAWEREHILDRLAEASGESKEELLKSAREDFLRRYGKNYL